MRRRLTSTVVMLLFSAAILTLSRCNPAFQRWISAEIAIPLAQLLGDLSARLAFAAFDALIAAGVLLFTAFLTICVVRSIKKRSFAPVKNWLSYIAVLLAVIVFVYAFSWAPLYASEPIKNPPGIVSASDSPDDLIQLCQRLIQKANVLRANLNEEKGIYAMSDPIDRVLAKVPALVGGVAITERTPAAPKVTRLSPLFDTLRVAGVYSPWTGEALVSSRDLPFSIAFTACHEAAHSIGYASEADANFIAYLACARGNWDFQYSGAITALFYAMQDLSFVDRPAWVALRSDMSEAVQRDFYTMNGFQTISIDKVSVYDRVADAFLRINGQNGLASYGDMVSRLLDWSASVNP